MCGGAHLLKTSLAMLRFAELPIPPTEGSMNSYQIDDEGRELAFSEWRFWLVSIVGSALAGVSVGSAVASLLVAG